MAGVASDDEARHEVDGDADREGDCDADREGACEADAVMTRPLMIYDGACGFCRYWIARWQRLTGEAIDYAPFQELGERFPEIGSEAFAAAVHLIEPDGRVSRGAEAVLRSLALCPEPRRAPRLAYLLYRRAPLVARGAEWVYRWVARHRRLVSRLLHRDR